MLNGNIKSADVTAEPEQFEFHCICTQKLYYSLYGATKKCALKQIKMKENIGYENTEFISSVTSVDRIDLLKGFSQITLIPLQGGEDIKYPAARLY